MILDAFCKLSVGIIAKMEVKGKTVCISYIIDDKWKIITNVIKCYDTLYLSLLLNIIEYLYRTQTCLWLSNFYVSLSLSNFKDLQL